MLRALRLSAALLAGLAVPAFAQAPSTSPPTTTNRVTPPGAATTGSNPSTGTSGTTGTTGTHRSGAASTAHGAASGAPAATATTPPSTGSASTGAASTGRASAGTSSSTSSTPSGSASITARTGAGATAGAAAGTAAGAAAAATSSKKIDINGANEQQIASLPGIGPAISKNIVQGRPWDDLNDLVKKKAVPQNVFDRNKDRFALANINTSSASDMAKTLPGIGDVRARAIVNGRPYAKPEDLVTKKVLTQNQFDKIKDVIAY